MISVKNICRMIIQINIYNTISKNAKDILRVHSIMFEKVT